MRALVVSLIAGSLALIVAITAGGLLPGSTTEAASTSVTVVNYAFQNGSPTIHACDTVTWTWSAANGNTPHSATSDAGQAMSWDSGSQTSGSFSVQFNTPGTFRYHCKVHSNMTGAITVLAAPTNTPVPPTATPVPPTPTLVPPTATSIPATMTPVPSATATATPISPAATASVAPTTSPTPSPATTATDVPASTATATSQPTAPPSATSTLAVPTSTPTVGTPSSHALALHVARTPHPGSLGTLRITVTDRMTGGTVAGAHVSVDARQVGIRSILAGRTDPHGMAKFARFSPRRAGMVTIMASRKGFAAAHMRLRLR